MKINRAQLLVKMKVNFTKQEQESAIAKGWDVKNFDVVIGGKYFGSHWMIVSPSGHETHIHNADYMETWQIIINGERQKATLPLYSGEVKDVWDAAIDFWQEGFPEAFKKNKD